MKAIIIYLLQNSFLNLARFYWTCPCFLVQALIYVRHKFVKAHRKMLPLIHKLHNEKQNEGHHYKHWHVLQIFNLDDY